MKLVLILVLLTSQSVVAAPRACSDLFSSRVPISRLAPAARRARLIEELRQAEAPAFVKESTAGPLPVVLVTQESAKAMSEFLATSMGQQTFLQPNTEWSDHGLIRIGDRIIDWAMPDTRNWGTTTGEIHSTGILWRSLRQRLERSAKKADDSKVTIEIAFALTPSQIDSLEFYHRVRRAALIAVQHENNQGKKKPEVPNVFPDWIWEGCFNYASGAIMNQLKGLTAQKLKAYGIENADLFFNQASARGFLSRARAVILAMDPMNPDTFNYDAIASKLRFSAREIFSKVKVSTDAERAMFINTLISYRAMSDAQSILRELGVDVNMTAGANIDNPQVSAVLVYAHPSQASRFKDATFTAEGSFDGTGWGADLKGKQRYLDQHPL